MRNFRAPTAVACFFGLAALAHAGEEYVAGPDSQVGPYVPKDEAREAEGARLRPTGVWR